MNNEVYLLLKFFVNGSADFPLSLHQQMGSRQNGAEPKCCNHPNWLASELKTIGKDVEVSSFKYC